MYALCRLLVKSVYQKNYFLYFSAKTYVVGAQKNRLNETVLIETVLLSTQNICFNLWVRKYLQLYIELICLSKPVTERVMCIY